MAGGLGTYSIRDPRDPGGKGMAEIRLQGHTRDLFQGQRRYCGGDWLMGGAARGSSMWGREQVAGQAQGVQCS